MGIRGSRMQLVVVRRCRKRLLQVGWISGQLARTCVAARRNQSRPPTPDGSNSGCCADSTSPPEVAMAACCYALRLRTVDGVCTQRGAYSRARARLVARMRSCCFWRRRARRRCRYLALLAERDQVASSARMRVHACGQDRCFNLELCDHAAGEVMMGGFRGSKGGNPK
jgi:hypothetical protein